MKHLKKQYQLNRLSLTFNLKLSEIDESQIESQIFRRGSERISPIVFSDAADIFDEIQTVVDLCQGKELETQTFFDALYEICKRHIDQYGRLIDNDMDSYIDRVLMVMNEIAISEGKIMSQESGITLRDLFTENILKSLLSHIYVTRRTPQGKAFLVKFSDELQNG